jgi:hypothetical protein
MAVSGAGGEEDWESASVENGGSVNQEEADGDSACHSCWADAGTGAGTKGEVG